MLSSANPDSKKGATYTVRQLLDEASVRLHDQFTGEPETEAAIRATIGNAYRRLQVTDKAEPHLRRALEIRRSLFADGRGSEVQVAHSLLDYGWNLYEDRRFPEAERHVREALAIYKRNGTRDAKLIEIYATLQLCLNGQFKYPDAEVVATEGLAVGRELFPQGHAELANILHRLASAKIAERKYAEAEPLARQALEMHERWHGSNHPETGWNVAVLSTICMEIGKLEEAERLDRRALAIFRTYYDDSQDPITRIREHLALVLTKRGDQAGVNQLRAESALRMAEALERGSITASVRMSTAKTFREAGQWDAAIQTYSREIAASPDAAEAYLGRGQCYLEKADFEKAAADFSAAIERARDLSEAWTGRALSHFHREQWEPAIADFTKAIELDPKVHTNWLHRGHTYLQLRQWDKAAADFGKLVEKWPQDSGGWFFLSGAHAQLNQPSKALSDLRQAIDNGFKDIEHLKTYSLLDPIRSNPDFKKLVVEMEEKKK
jgi:tetratricopeptide (TPR) repeat protein